MKQGDYVVRKSYGGDVLFRIESFWQHSAILKGIDYRLLADAPLGDLDVIANPEQTGASQEVKIKVNETMRRIQQQTARLEEQRSMYYGPRPGMPKGGGPYFEVPGKVLHLDGDGSYLRKSMQLYNHMRVPAQGLHAHESQMPGLLQQLLPSLQPDIIVITGHDGLLKNRPEPNLQQLSSYKNSQNFVNAVRVARNYDHNRDSLIIIAGACQSHFEALLQAGANFASSPDRILIHALDPVYIAVKASQTPIRETISLNDAIYGTISGAAGVGGIETSGTYRVGMPRPKQVKAIAQGR
ncbi:sporulation peptidase YabG [Paenibacillus tarimensis]|uniref:sporulation peptidase YabG n=1 Tax=Paenibacillus tarimensis TaxID=416012 RepID=UPI001F2DEBDF|nr:sporulation peptidase YabG [Paenibacillus tarimensis]MCF2946229.1 sporulation peptidase YabG [Paenibacillus tarimensis]